MRPLSPPPYLSERRVDREDMGRGDLARLKCPQRLGMHCVRRSTGTLEISLGPRAVGGAWRLGRR
jgi:hypothetical protein